MSSDLELLLLFRDTRRCDAFDAIVARHGPMVFRLVLRVLRDHHEAEDVVQQTFLQLAKHPESACPHLVGWLHRTATNAARNHLRSRARRVRHEVVKGRAMVETRRDNPEELREEIDAALDRLPADLREAVILHYFEGRDYSESARLAGCSEEALRKRSQRGLRRLRDHLADRGIVCGLGVLTVFLGVESAANASVPTTLLANLTRVCTDLPPGQAAAARSQAEIEGVFWTKIKVVAAAAVLASGGLGYVAARGLARDRAPAVPVVAGSNTDRAATAHASFRTLSLGEAATVASSQPIFWSKDRGIDVLIPRSWGEFTALVIPFRVDDPRDGSTRNVIVLKSPIGDSSRLLPRSASVRCGGPARRIHLLSGVSGWGYPWSTEKTVSLIVRLNYADGAVEDHPLINGVHFADYFKRAEVPGSKQALRLKHGHQMRYLAITPARPGAIERIDFLKGVDRTAPIIMAATVETAG